jgi:hypothetical protein
VTDRKGWFNVSVYSLPETDNASRINNTNPMSPLG